MILKIIVFCYVGYLVNLLKVILNGDFMEWDNVPIFERLIWVMITSLLSSVKETIL